MFFLAITFFILVIIIWICIFLILDFIAPPPLLSSSSLDTWGSIILASQTFQSLPSFPFLPTTQSSSFLRSPSLSFPYRCPYHRLILSFILSLFFFLSLFSSLGPNFMVDLSPSSPFILLFSPLYHRICIIL